MPLNKEIHAIVFDWGDTLMANDPAQSGPMADWPVVSALPGAVEVLGKLKADYRLCLASNAQASGRDQIRVALERVGLDDRVEEIFTMHELGGAKKPERAFFEGIAAKLGLQPNQLLMVGDEYPADVAGASAAGWHTAWFNLRCEPALLLAPVYDVEISGLADLPQALQQETLPRIEDCRTWYLGQKASANLMVHVEMVAAIAYQIAFWLREQGEAVDPLLAHRGGLLHDVCKISTREGPLHHPEAGARFLEARGQVTLAEIVRRHGVYSLLEENTSPRTWEEKLVYYADKLVESNRIVPVTLCLQRIRERYGLDPQVEERLVRLITGLEAEICRPLGVSGEELNRRLGEAFVGG